MTKTYRKRGPLDINPYGCRSGNRVTRPFRFSLHSNEETLKSPSSTSSGTLSSRYASARFDAGLLVSTPSSSGMTTPSLNQEDKTPVIHESPVASVERNGMTAKLLYPFSTPFKTRQEAKDLKKELEKKVEEPIASAVSSSQASSSRGNSYTESPIPFSSDLKSNSSRLTQPSCFLMSPVLHQSPDIRRGSDGNYHICDWRGDWKRLVPVEDENGDEEGSEGQEASSENPIPRFN